MFAIDFITDLPTDMLTFSVKRKYEKSVGGFKIVVSGLVSRYINTTENWKQFVYPMPPEKSFKILIWGKKGNVILKDPQRFTIQAPRGRRWNCNSAQRWKIRCGQVRQGQLLWPGQYIIHVKDAGTDSNALGNFYEHIE